MSLPGIEQAPPVTGDLPTPLTHNTQQHYTTALEYNVPVVFRARYVMIWRGGS